jgi:hypothetical protein
LAEWFKSFPDQRCCENSRNPEKEPEGAVMKEAFIIYHIAKEGEPDEDVKLVGVYSSRKKAITAVERLRKLPGFKDYSDGFYIESYTMDEDAYPDGFSTKGK